MKIRNGLVSNSSTSSFIFFGYDIDNNPSEIVEKLTGKVLDRDDAWEEISDGAKIDGIENFVHFKDFERDGTAIGFEPMYVGEYRVSSELIDFDELNKDMDTLAEKLGLDKSKKKLFGGIEYC